MKVLLIGSGGREHALAEALAASPMLTALYAAPGNPGIGTLATCLALNIADHDAIAGFCAEEGIELVVVGPEAPLAAGIADDLAARGIAVFGPQKAAAQLEASKTFTKDICDAFSIPTAAHASFESRAAALAHLAAAPLPVVIKRDGLAAGKGVTVAATRAAAEEAINAAFDAGDPLVLVEECMMGEEVSVFAISDGKTALFMGDAQDHKAAYDGDTGPNTGGMGAYSPAPILTDALRDQVMDTVVRPTIAGMAARGTPFVGILYAGLMVTKDGPKLIEFNVRFGDPEAQVLLPRLKDDLLLLMKGAVDGVLHQMTARFYDAWSLGVVLASRGYPGAYETGAPLHHLDAIAGLSDIRLYHAGTTRENNQLVSNGGRVLTVCAMGNSASEAQTRAYYAVDQLNWPGGFCRRDIGWRAVEREKGPALPRNAVSDDIAV